MIVPLPPETVPAVVPGPSPQLIVAVKSLARFARSVSVNVATVTLLRATPVIAAIGATLCPVSTSPSPTVTLPLAVAFALSEVRLSFTLSGSVPSSA